MTWMRHSHFRSLIHGRGRNHDVLKPAHFFDDHDLDDDARDDAADVAHDHQQHHEPRNGRAAFKRGIARRLAGGAPVFGREELDCARDDFLARKVRLFRKNGISHSF